MNLGYPVQIARAAAHRPIIVFAIKVSAVVGTILNLINQGSVLTGGANFDWVHCLLNYLVPFLVSAFSGGRNELRQIQARNRKPGG